jgi:hypothetical protein
VTREELVTTAQNAADKAAVLAGEAEAAAHSFHDRDMAERLAAASTAWASVARSHAAIAALLPTREA